MSELDVSESGNEFTVLFVSRTKIGFLNKPRLIASSLANYNYNSHKRCCIPDMYRWTTTYAVLGSNR